MSKMGTKSPFLMKKLIAQKKSYLSKVGTLQRFFPAKCSTSNIDSQYCPASKDFSYKISPSDTRKTKFTIFKNLLAQFLSKFF